MSQTQQRQAENANGWDTKDGGVSSATESIPSPSPRAGRKPPKLSSAVQKAPPPQQQQRTQPPPAREQEQYQDQDQDQNVMAPPAARGRRIVPVHQSRIQDRPAKVGEKDSSLKIKIELDLEVEVEIYARVKGDVTIGLM